MLCLSPCSRYMSFEKQQVVGGVLVGTGLWVAIFFTMRTALKWLLSWHGWMYAHHGTVSWRTRIWLVSRLQTTMSVVASWETDAG